MKICVYLDNNATTRPHREVLAAMREYEENLYLNASSTAGEVLGAARPLSEARAAMASLLGASDEDQIVLTSGATEANAWVFYSVPERGHIVTSSIEHSSIIAVSERARIFGHPVDVVGVDRTGLVSLGGLAKVVRPDTRLVSFQFANNETGVVQPLAEIGALVRSIAPDALIHSDATQAVGRVALDLSKELAEIDLLSFSGHKFHAPKGIGGLFIRSGIELDPLIPGEQEHGKRGGTSNVPAAAGLAVAARRAKLGLTTMTAVAALRDELEALLSAMVPGACINAKDAQRLPNTSSVTLPGSDGDHVVEQLALQGICVATGSACTAGANAPSHVLTAMGLTAAAARSTLRLSLSSETSKADIDATVAAVQGLLKVPVSTTCRTQGGGAAGRGSVPMAANSTPP